MGTREVCLALSGIMRCMSVRSISVCMSVVHCGGRRARTFRVNPWCLALLGILWMDWVR